MRALKTSPVHELIETDSPRKLIPFILCTSGSEFTWMRCSFLTSSNVGVHSEVPRSFLEACAPIRRHFEAELQRAAELGAVRGERTPLAATVRTCRQLLRLAPALWTFLEIPGVEPTTNSAERALRQAVIQRKISHGVQSAARAQGRAQLLTVVVSLRQQGRDVLNFLEQAWVAQRLGGVMPSLVPNG